MMNTESVKTASIYRVLKYYDGVDNGEDDNDVIWWL